MIVPASCQAGLNPPRETSNIVAAAGGWAALRRDIPSIVNTADKTAAHIRIGTNSLLDKTPGAADAPNNKTAAIPAHSPIK